MSGLSPPPSGASTGWNAHTPSEGSTNGGSSSGMSSRLNTSFPKGLMDRNTTKAGQPQKRRGPKPDSKPAVTRRQELNRQAQRTHRERKEYHMKELELQVVLAKQAHTDDIQKKIAVEEENRMLKQILDLHNIHYPTRPRKSTSLQSNRQDDDSMEINAFDFSQTPATTNVSTHTSTFMPEETLTQAPALASPLMRESTAYTPEFEKNVQTLNLQDTLDYNEIALTFILKLEETCADHVDDVCVPAQYHPHGSMNGHTLMVSSGNVQDREILKENLRNLLDLSLKLPLEGEITPIMAWVLIASNERFHELTRADFTALGIELKRKTRCYGFGSALEDFEVRDALSNVFATKLESYVGFT